MRKESLKQYIRDNKRMVLMVAVTFVLITITGILYADSYIVICPLYISLIIMLCRRRPIGILICWVR